MKIAVTRMSSKGQVVIPVELRGDMEEGEDLVIIRQDEQIILEKVSKIANKLKDNLIFAKRTEEALKRYEKGEFTEMSGEEFEKEIAKW